MRFIQIYALLLVAACCPAFIPYASGQCGPQWISQIGINGVRGTVAAIHLWDPDGPGPLTVRLVLGGSFSVAGDRVVEGIAAWDGATWYRMGNGMGNTSGFVTAANGELLACLSSASGGSSPIRGVARWNGAGWVQFATKLGGNARVASVASLANGSFIIGGDFVTTDGKNIANLAHWNGSEWTSLGGNPSNTVNAVRVLSNGDILAAGAFGKIGSVTTGFVARWNGNLWNAAGSFGTIGEVICLTRSSTDDIYVGANTQGGHRIFRLNGFTWEPLGGVVEGAIRALELSSEGTLYAAGTFSRIGSTTVNSIARWSSVGAGAWQSPVAVPASYLGDIMCLFPEAGGSMIVGGGFSRISGIGAHSVARLQQGTWSNLASGFAGEVLCSVATPDGRLVVGGNFTSINGIPFGQIAMWDGYQWKAMGTGFDGNVSRMIVDAQGNVVAAGQMRRNGTELQTQIRKWNGSSWVAVSQHWFPFGVENLIAMKNGNIAISASSYGGPYSINGRVAIFDGTKWNGLGSQPTNAPSGMAELDNGDLIVAGKFFASNTQLPRVLRWNGSTWSEVGTGTANWYDVGSVVPLVGDEFAVVGHGTYSFDSSVMLWRQSTWKSIGSATTVDYKLLPIGGGRLLAYGAFSSLGGVQAKSLAAWDGATWRAMGTSASSARVNSVAIVSEHEIVAFGGVAVNDWSGMGLARRVDSLTPIVSAAAEPATFIRGQELLLKAAATPGFAELAGGLQVAWIRDGSEISNGGGGASPGGGFVSGGIDTLVVSQPSTLSIANVQPSDRGLYSIRFRNSCGEATSIPVEVKVKAHITDINADGQVDDADFVLFVDQYNIMLCADPMMPDSCSADFNHDGMVDDADFEIFVPAFEMMLFE